MEQQPYSVRELDAKFKSIEQLVTLFHSETMTAIKSCQEEVKSQNTRLNNLEEDNSKNKGFATAMSWIVGIVTTVVLSVTAYFFSRIENLSNLIK